jgi:hypothetical protein
MTSKSPTENKTKMIMSEFYVKKVEKCPEGLGRRFN